MMEPRRWTCGFPLAVFTALCLVPQAGAEQVTPNDRVTSKLRVRAEANTSAGVVGYLKPGDRVQLVRTKGAWREVKAASWTGYVATGYTTVIPDDVAGRGGQEYSIRLGSWNIKKLGHGGNKDYAKLAPVIDREFDILAVVEVMQKNGAHPGYDSLMQQLGEGWTGQVTHVPRPATSSGSAEYYAIIWRSSTLRPCTGWDGLRYFADNDGGGSGTGPDNFVREPAFGCYSYGPADRPAGDFILAAYHATFKSGAAIDTEVAHLGEVFAAMAAARAGEKDLIIVGDFNRTPPQIARLLPDVQDMTSGSGSTLNSSGEITANLYDHVLVRDGDATTEMQGNATVLDVRLVAGSPAAYFTTMSDHLPIVVTLTSSEDDDP